VVIELPFVAERKGKPVDLRIPLSRERVNTLVMDLVEKTFQLVEKVLGEKNLPRADIQEVLLVGGQTRMPLVQGKAHQFFGKPPRKGVHPDESVALGAALLAESMQEIDSVTLVDALSMPIGFAMPGGRFRKVIEKNTQIPSKSKLPPAACARTSARAGHLSGRQRQDHRQRVTWARSGSRRRWPGSG